MSWDSKVLWTEGLFLQPHHFQQADRHAEALVAGLASRIVPYAWGVSSLEIDDEALKVGQFAIKSAAGPDPGRHRVPGAAGRHPPAGAGGARTRSRTASSTSPSRSAARARPRST